MKTSTTTSPRFSAVKRFTVIMMVCWTLVVGALLIWNIADEHGHTIELAKKEALVTFNKDQAFRFWATKHGGVYVPATEETPPNPYLTHVPDRDITLPSGKKLTLMNPAYALRQLMHDFEQDYGIKGHITSLKPMNPANAPDAWERAALQNFDQGIKEVSETVTIDGKPYARLIRPMVVKKGCLKCHAQQGYREGDIRGGVGISFPIEPFLIIERDAIRILLATHGGIWLLGLGGIGFVYSRSKKNIVERSRAEEAVRESRERFSQLVEATSDFVWEANADHVCTYVSPKIKDILGYEPGEIVGRSTFDLIPPDESGRVVPALKAATASRKPFSFIENVNVHKDGRSIILEDSGVPFFDASGAFLGYRGMSRDVTDRRHVEAENHRLRAFFQNVADSIITGVWVADREDVVFYVNKAVVDIAGTSPAALIGVRVLDYISAPAMKEFSLLYRRAKETMAPVRYDGIRLITPAGSESYQSGWLVPRTREGLQYDGMICTVEEVTEQKKAEQLLALLNFALNSVHEEAYLIDEDSRFQYVNDETCRALGYGREELLGMSVANVDPDFPPDRWPAHWRELKEKGSLTFEGRHQTRDGRIFPVEIHANYFEYDGHGFNLALVRDITERKKAEEALHRGEERLNEAQRMAHIGSWELDLQRNKLIWSDEIYRIFERDSGSFGATYEAFLSMIHPDDRAAVNAAYTNSVLKRTPYAIEHRLLFPDERIKYVREQCETYYDSEGKPLRSLGTVQDITERKQAEDALREREAFIRNILDSVDEGFIVVDRQYRVLSVNRAFCSAMKLAEDRVIGRPCYEVSHNASRPCFESGEDCAVRRTFESGTACLVSHTHTGASGEKQYVEIKAYPITNAAGTVVSAIETINDITERRKLEEQLRQAQKMEAVGTLAGGVAHDFNNILTAIIGYGNIVKMKMKEDDPLRASMDTILSSSERAAHLTQGLLAFSRKQIINPRPVNLNDIVRSVEKLLRRLIGEDVDLSTVLCTGGLTVLADMGQVEQVLMNLATNARDAMPQGGMLTITTQELDLDEEFMKIHAYGKPGRYALIAVSDTGTGMDAQTKEKIFEPFFTTKELGRGTGLGLSIVYGIIKQHNGSIAAYSEPGRGSTFKIYLPLVAASAEAAGARAVTAPRGGTETILIAEDDQTVRELIRTILRDFGYRVLEAADGQEAIESFTSHAGDVDLLIIDVIMPKKSGRDVYDAVMEIKPDVKAVFMSGYTADVIHKKGVLDEGIQFISKPINPGDLLRKIREVLDLKK